MPRPAPVTPAVAATVSRRYYAAWLGMPETAFDDLANQVVVSVHRDRTPAGHAAPIPCYGLLRDGHLLVALGEAFAAAHAEATASLRRAVGSAGGDFTPARVDRLLTDAGLGPVQWSVKFVFGAPRPNAAGPEAICLEPQDYERYEAFFRAVRPGTGNLEWLPAYFESLARQRLCWGVEVDGALVAVSDAPSMPYMADALVELGINTHPEHRRRGYARVACQAAIDHVLSQGKVPLWSCGVDNAASRALAAALGFGEFGRAAMIRGTAPGSQ